MDSLSPAFHGRCRLPHDQAGADFDLRSIASFVTQIRIQRVKRFLAQLCTRETNGGERRLSAQGQFDIIETYK